MKWVSFNKLGIGKIYLNDYAFSVFGLKVKWYAIIICFAILSAFFCGLFLTKKLHIKKDNFLDVTTIGLICGVIGARVYYVMFNFGEFSSNLISIFNLRTGGLAIYGGIIFSVVSALIYCKVKKIKFLPILDVAGVCFLLGQAIGRWGNFVNVEAYGTKTNSLFGMSSNAISTEMQPAHPTFFYESLWCFLGFILLLCFLRRRIFQGQIFLMYLSWYGFGRFFIEGLRTDSLWLFNNTIRVSQLLSLIIFCLSVVLHIYFLIYYINKNKIKKRK